MLAGVVVEPGADPVLVGEDHRGGGLAKPPHPRATRQTGRALSTWRAGRGGPHNAAPVKRRLRRTSAPLVLVVSDEIFWSIVARGYRSVDDEPTSRSSGSASRAAPRVGARAGFLGGRTRPAAVAGPQLLDCG